MKVLWNIFKWICILAFLGTMVSMCTVVGIAGGCNPYERYMNTETGEIPYPDYLTKDEIAKLENCDQ